MFKQSGLIPNNYLLGLELQKTYSFKSYHNFHLFFTSSSFPGETLTEPMIAVAGQFYSNMNTTHSKFFQENATAHAALCFHLDSRLEQGDIFPISKKLGLPHKSPCSCNTRASCCYCHILPRKS